MGDVGGGWWVVERGVVRVESDVWVDQEASLLADGSKEGSWSALAS